MIFCLPFSSQRSYRSFVLDLLTLYRVDEMQRNSLSLPLFPSISTGSILIYGKYLRIGCARQSARNRGVPLIYIRLTEECNRRERRGSIRIISPVTLDRDRLFAPVSLSLWVPAFIPLLARATSSRPTLYLSWTSMPARCDAMRCDACVGRANGSLRHGSSSHCFVDSVAEGDDTHSSHVNRTLERSLARLDQRRKPCRERSSTGK